MSGQGLAPTRPQYNLAIIRGRKSGNGEAGLTGHGADAPLALMLAGVEMGEAELQ